MLCYYVLHVHINKLGAMLVIAFVQRATHISQRVRRVCVDFTLANNTHMCALFNVQECMQRNVLNNTHHNVKRYTRCVCTHGLCCHTKDIPFTAWDQHIRF